MCHEPKTGRIHHVKHIYIYVYTCVYIYIHIYIYAHFEKVSGAAGLGATMLYRVITVSSL